MRALAELMIGVWPLGLTIAAAVVADRVREARRRSALNGALHELRRPLQALVLASGSGKGPGAHAIRVALASLGDLDRAINGGPRPLARRPIACRALVQPAVERWRGPAAAARRSLELRWRAGAAVVMADPDRVAQALDNLIDNALRHGGLRVLVDASVGARGVRIAVSDTGRTSAREELRSNPRHGHGLRIVSRIAAEHGGSFRLRRSPAGAVATLELPLAARALPAVARGLDDAAGVAAAESGTPLRAAA